MKPLTKQEAIQEHRKMWNWIADETEKRKIKVNKEKYFKEMNIPYDEQPSHHCYCCEYDMQQDKDCDSCPIDWGSKTSIRQCMNMFTIDYEGIYGQWLHCTDYKQSASLARQIANLPEYKDKIIMGKLINWKKKFVNYITKKKG